MNSVLTQSDAENRAFPVAYEDEILQLLPQDDITTQSLKKR